MYDIGTEVARNGSINRGRACPSRMKFRLPADVTSRLSVSEIVGMTAWLTPRIAIRAV